MRLMAEENKQKTDQLLFTSPVTATSIVVGKLLAVFTLFGLVMLITCLYPLILSLYGTIPFASAYASILAFALMGAAYLSIGLFISALTESQIVAAVITYVLFVFTFFMEGIASILPSDNKSALVIFTVILLAICLILYLMMKNLTISVMTGVIVEAAMVVAYFVKPTLFDGSVANVVGWLSVVSRFDNFYYGMFDVSGIVYYLSVTCLFVFLTVQAIRKKRWS
jgi:ABC-2 type transport system permease protein